MNPSDAHAMDVKYHITCWDENVTNVLRKMLFKLRARNALRHCIFGSHGNWIQEMYNWIHEFVKVAFVWYSLIASSMPFEIPVLKKFKSDIILNSVSH